MNSTTPSKDSEESASEEGSFITRILHMLQAAVDDEDIHVVVIFAEPKHQRMSMALMNCEMEQGVALAQIVATVASAPPDTYN